MTTEERRLLMAVARWVAKKEQEEVDRLDLNPVFVDELRRLMAAVAAEAAPAAPPAASPSLIRLGNRSPHSL